MRFVSDIHGAVGALRRAAGDTSYQLIVLGDLINVIDYRSMSGIMVTVLGREAVEEIIRLRQLDRWDDARQVRHQRFGGSEEELRAAYAAAIDDAYAEICPALEGSTAIVTYGNVDDIRQMREKVPAECTLVEEAEVFEIEGMRVGVVGGGAPTPLGVPGEVPDDEMERRLRTIGPVDVLCTHAAPATRPLCSDVIGGAKGSRPLLSYLYEHKPDFHYFGDIHQPQATTWRVGDTVCRNVGYFRSTGRAVRHRGRH